MIVVNITRTSPEQDAINQAAAVLRRGGVIIYPSDTCYGIGCDARNTRAMDRVAAIKGRDHAKKFSVIVRDLEHVRSLTAITTAQEEILNAYLPGPYTFILMNTDFTVAKTNTLGVRIPNNLVTAALSASFGEPYITSSANFSGMGAVYAISDLYTSFLDTLPPEEQPDLILNAGNLPVVPASTVVDLTQPTPTIIRQGAGEFHWPKEI